MLKRADIDAFYEDVEAIGLKFPVAAIAASTGESKGNVSKILGRKLDPSESFLKRFYDKFPKSSLNVSRETAANEPNQEYHNLKDELIASLKRENAMLREKNSSSKGIIDRIESIAAMQIMTMEALALIAQSSLKKDAYSKIVEMSKRMESKDIHDGKGN